MSDWPEPACHCGAPILMTTFNIYAHQMMAPIQSTKRMACAYDTTHDVRDAVAGWLRTDTDVDTVDIERALKELGL